MGSRAREEAERLLQRAAANYNTQAPQLIELTQSYIKTKQTVPTDLQKDLKSLSDAVTTANTNFETLDKKVFTLNEIITLSNNLVTQYQTQLAEYDTANSAFQQAVSNYDNLTITQLRIKGTATKPLFSGGASLASSADLKAALDKVTSDVEDRERKLSVLQGLDKREKNIKKDAYTNLIGIMTEGNYDKVQSRAIEHQRKHPELVFDKALYGAYPPVYLRTLQILYGFDITSRARAGDFAMAANAFPPDEVFRIIGADLNVRRAARSKTAISNIYDANFQDPDNLDILNNKMINTLMTTVIDQAKAGIYRDIGAGVKRDVERMKKQIPTEFTLKTQADIAAVKLIMNDIYYYYDIDDLARLIYRRRKLASYSTINVTTMGDAKGFAIEVDKMKQKLF